MSEAITRGVRVRVSPRYIPEQSAPLDRRYVFAYHVRILNESERTVQLRSRHWVITDSTGKVEEVRGPGVVGVQPTLNPGQAFEYTSGAILQTSRGKMEGTYQMVDDSGAEFDAHIAAFDLVLPRTLN